MSGFRVTWDSSRPKGQRVVSIRLALDQKDSNHAEPSDEEPTGLDGAPVERQKGGQMYKVVTRQYMAEGHDGYNALKGCKYLIDDENGKLMSALVRQYLLGEWKFETILPPNNWNMKWNSGCQYINKFRSLESIANHSFLDARTSGIINEERQNQHQHQHQSSGGEQPTNAMARWKQIVVDKVLSRSKKRMEEAFSVSGREHMAGVDCYNGTTMRGAGKEAVSEQERKTLDEAVQVEARKHLVTIEPVVDGRMKDIARE